LPYIAYVKYRPTPDVLDLIQKADQVANQYANQNFDLTVRQLFYQFVSNNWLLNTPQAYNRIKDIIKKARLGGLIDWDHITDRTRWTRENSHWNDPADLIDSAVSSYANEKWRGQPIRPVVLIEKDALAGVIDGTCRALDVPYFPCRGYSSISELWALVQNRLLDYIKNDQLPVILYLGDHDPSGVDMDRDVQDRLRLFIKHHTGIPDVPQVIRLGLNAAQINQYQPPANSAKTLDKRYPAYIKKYGTNNCWELDALAPPVIAGLIRDAVLKLRNEDQWNDAVKQEEETRKQLEQVSDRWDDVVKFLNNGNSTTK